MTRSSALLPVVLCAAALFRAGDAYAAERGWYLGAGYSNVSADHPTSAVAFPTGGAGGPAVMRGASAEPLVPAALIALIGPESIGSHGYRITAGYRALDWLAFETDYLDLEANSASYNIVCITQPCPAKARAESSAASMSALALWPRGKFDLFVRAGLMRWKSSFDEINSDGSHFYSHDEYGTDGKYGAGAQFHARQFTARLEYERLRFGGIDADSWSIGGFYSFR